MKRLLPLWLFLAAWAAVMAVIWLLPPSPLPAPPPAFPPPNPPSGAALFYNQAFAAMPNLSVEEQKCLYANPEKPLDRPLAQKIVERFGPTLDLLAQGAKEPSCEWGVDLNAIEKMSWPNGINVMLCRQALSLRARLHLEEGNTAEAVDDLLLSLRLSRQAGEPPIPICVLGRITNDNALLTITLRELPKFDKASLQKLADGLKTLPPSSSMAESIALERKLAPAFVYIYVTQLRTDVPWYKRVFYKLIGIVHPHPNFQICKASPETLADWTRDMQTDIEIAERAMRLPYAQGEPQIEAIEQKIKTGTNPLAVVQAPPMKSLRQRELISETLWSIFQTALEARLHHPEEIRTRLATLIDPFTGKPLECYDVEDGVEITLRRPGRNPEQWTVGLEKTK